MFSNRWITKSTVRFSNARLTSDKINRLSGEACCPREIADQAVCIDTDIEALQELLKMANELVQE